MCLCACVRVCMCLCVHVSLHLCVHVSVCACISLHVYVSLLVCACVCAHVSVCTCVCAHMSLWIPVCEQMTCRPFLLTVEESSLCSTSSPALVIDRHRSEAQSDSCEVVPPWSLELSLSNHLSLKETETLISEP